MSKKLLIVRHAKSDWKNSGLRDFDRPLNERGLRDAPEVAARLARSRLIPEQIISSPALRAITTAELFAKELDYDRYEIVQIPRIYEARTSTLLDIINKFDSQYNFVALFGHNPGVTNLVMKLTDKDINDLPTCGLVLVRFPFDDWAMVSGGTGEIKYEDYPKLHVSSAH